MKARSLAIGVRKSGDDAASNDMHPKTDLNNIMDELIANNKHNVRVRPSTPRKPRASTAAWGNVKPR